MYLDPSEKVTFRTTIAWILPFNLGQFIDPVMRRISEIKKRNALMETTVANFTNVASLIVVDGSGTSSDNQPIPRECVYCLCFKPQNTQPVRHLRQHQLFLPNQSFYVHIAGDT